MQGGEVSIGEWREDCLCRLSRHGNENALFDEALALTKELGFDYLGFGIQLNTVVNLSTLVKHVLSYLDRHVADPNKSIVLFDNHPPGVMEIFKKEFAHDDPLIKHARRSIEILVWSDAVFADQPTRMDLMRRFGLAHGLSQPSRSQTGSVALANFTRTLGEISVEELNAKRPKISMLTSIFHTELEAILMQKFAPPLPQLSSEDKAILRWAALGHPASEIATILGMKERAVTLRKKTMAQELHARNFAQAMLIAASLNLLH
jgi:DNA-binding CsgD family transcriptional regulator